jgi:microsomal epoxide hydrolase
MPAWIWQHQIDDLARTYRVIALDPRGQGDSAVPTTGYEPHRRGADIAELLTHLGPEKPLIVAWSLGVLDTLAHIHDSGDTAIAGLVLVDNSIGEDPPPVATPPRPGPKPPREVAMRDFVKSMFAHKQPQSWLDRLTSATLRTPAPAAAALLAYPVPRTFWKEAIYATAKPVLYIVRPKFEGQAANLAARHPSAETQVVQSLGHALFVDDAPRFNTTLRAFIARRIWPQ